MLLVRFKEVLIMVNSCVIELLVLNVMDVEFLCFVLIELFD